MSFSVYVVQREKRAYFDAEKDKTVEYEAENGISGTFYDWESVEVFTNNILKAFPDTTVKININREAE